MSRRERDGGFRRHEYNGRRYDGRCDRHGSGNLGYDDDLPDAFECAAAVGTAGSGIEQPMESMVNVVSGAHADPGECNEGFLRDDALLFIVILTDEWDGPVDPEIQGSSGTAQDWYDAVVEAKGGVAEHAVAMALINYAASATCPPVSAPFDGVHIASFVDLFGANGLLAGVCEDDFGPAMSDAVDILGTACADFSMR